MTCVKKSLSWLLVITTLMISILFGSITAYASTKEDSNLVSFGSDDSSVTNAPQIVIESKNAGSGDTIELSIELQNAETLKSIALYGFSFDSDCLELVSGEWKLQGGTLKNVNITNKTAAIAFDANTDCNGEIFVLTFKVKEGTSSGTYPVSCSITAKRKDTAGEVAYSISSVSGSIVVISSGDFNGDGTVDPLDLARLRKYLANYDYSESESSVKICTDADMNGDGVINLKDLVALRKELADKSE